MSVYEINTECVTVSILSYASERYRNQNKDRNTGGFNKMHVHFLLEVHAAISLQIESHQ